MELTAAVSQKSALYTTGHANARKESAARPDHCHPDIKANGTTGQQLVPIGSACANYHRHLGTLPTPSIDQPRQLAFTGPQTFASVRAEREGKPSKRAPPIT